jgi:hypothetical protein
MSDIPTFKPKKVDISDLRPVVTTYLVDIASYLPGPEQSSRCARRSLTQGGEQRHRQKDGLSRRPAKKAAGCSMRAPLFP